MGGTSLQLTSTWIPLGLLAVLAMYMFHLFRQERRQSLELIAAETATAASAPKPDALEMEAAHAVEAAPEAAAAAPVPAPAAAPVPAPMAATSTPAKRKASLVWRTAWIWLPFLTGFAGQAWLDIVKPLVEKSGA